MLLDALPEARRETILRASMQDIAQLSQQLQAEAQKGDAEAVQRTVHSLRGVAGNIGAASLAHAVRDQNKVDAREIARLAADTLSEIRRRLDLDAEAGPAQ